MKKCALSFGPVYSGGSSQGGRSPEVCRFVHTRPMDLGLETQSSRGRGTTVRMWHTTGGEGRAVSLAELWTYSLQYTGPDAEPTI